MEKCLKVLCRSWLENYENRNIDDICLVYDWAINLQMNQLQVCCERKIDVYCEQIFKTEGFLSCSFNVLDHILNLDALFCDESVVLGACLKWAQHQCNQNAKDENDMQNLREYLIVKSTGTNLLQKVRYGSIEHSEFLPHFDANDGLFADAEECHDVIRLLLGSKNLKTGKFQTEPRTPLLWIDEHAIECILIKNEFCPELEATGPIVHILRTNQAILFGGFFMIRIMSGNVDSNSIPINVSIEEQQKNGDASNITTKLIHAEGITVTKGTNDYVRILHPVVMKSDCEYRIKFYFKSKICFLDEVAYSTFRRKDLTIRTRTENDAVGFLIKRLKFIQL